MAKRKRRSPGDGGLWQRPDGMWIGSVEVSKVDGTRGQRRVYSMNYRECKRKKDELEDAIKDGYVPTTASTTVEKWLGHWLETIKRPHVRPNTYQFYEESVRLHIVPAIGGKRLGHLTAEDVRGMLATVETTRNAQRAHQTLKLALKDAKTNGLLRNNVCEAVTKPEHLARTRGAFTVKDAVTVMDKAIEIETSRDESDPLLATRWIAAFFTAARKAELLGLEWDRVDLSGAEMDLAWQLQQLKQSHGCGGHDGGTYPCGKGGPGWCPQRRWNLPKGTEYRDCEKSLLWTRPKTKTGTRVVPIVAPLLSMLAIHRDNTAHQLNPHGLVWHWPDGRPISPTDDQANWTALLKAAKLPHAEIHAARHTTATLLQSVGVPEDVRMRIMGQSSAAAQRMYVHVDQSQTRAALSKLTDLLVLNP